jgi:hypothetical protein
VALSGFIKSAIKWASGINWVNISIRFAMSVLENRVIPVKLPPGWFSACRRTARCFVSSRAQWCAVAQASMPTRHGASAPRKMPSLGFAEVAS